MIISSTYSALYLELANVFSREVTSSEGYTFRKKCWNDVDIPQKVVSLFLERPPNSTFYRVMASCGCLTTIRCAAARVPYWSLWPVHCISVPQSYIAGLVLHVCCMVTENNVWCLILKSCIRRLILESCTWRKILNVASGWRLTGVRCNVLKSQLRRNISKSGVRRNISKPTPDAIFCDHASDVYHEWHSVLVSMNWLCMTESGITILECKGFNITIMGSPLHKGHILSIFFGFSLFSACTPQKYFNFSSYYLHLNERLISYALKFDRQVCVWIPP